MVSDIVGNKGISLNIPIDMYNKCRTMGWSLKEVWILGFLAKEDNPRMLDRIAEQDRAIERLQGLATKLSLKLEMIEEKDAKPQESIPVRLAPKTAAVADPGYDESIPLVPPRAPPKNYDNKDDNKADDWNGY